MATYYSREQVGVLDNTTRPPLLADGQIVNAKERVTRATINFADRVYAQGDNVVLGKRPANSRYIGHRLVTSTSLGTCTLNLGTFGSLAKYAAGVALTNVDTPTPVARAAQVAADKLVNEELQVLTFGVAAPPTTGLMTVEFFYTYD